MKKKQPNELFDNIEEVKSKLQCMRSYYNEITDDNLITSCIYEINALNARYSHLICEAKSSNASSEMYIHKSRFEKI